MPDDVTDENDPDAPITEDDDAEDAEELIGEGIVPDPSEYGEPAEGRPLGEPPPEEGKS